MPSLWISVDYGRFEIDLRHNMAAPPHGGEPVSRSLFKQQPEGLLSCRKHGTGYFIYKWI